jgi:predicted MFS family arabinose efflux permease
MRARLASDLALPLKAVPPLPVTVVAPYQRMMNAIRNQRDFATLFLVMLITGAGNTALQSVLPSLGRSIGAPDYLIAAVFSVSAVIWVIAAPFWAARSDREGRRAMVLTGMAGFSISILLVGIVLTAGIKGLIGPVTTVIAVVFARLIYGAFGSAAPPAAQAMVALSTTREERTKALTMLGSAFGLGTILGPALAPYMVVPGAGLAGPAYFFAVIGFAVLIAAWWTLPHDEPGSVAHGASVSYPTIGGAPAGASITSALEPQTSVKLPTRDPRIWPWLLTGLVSGHAQAMAGAAMGFLVIDRLHLPVAQMATQQSIGLVLMMGAGAALLMQWGVIPLLGLTPRLMVMIGLVMAALGMAATSSADSLSGIASAYALSSMGFGFIRPAITAGSSLAVGKDLQGAVAGRVTANNGAAFILGPSIGVVLYGVWQPLPYLVSAIVLALMIFYVQRRLVMLPA